MLVGNVATLRPLFRHMLHLGSEDSGGPSNLSGANPVSNAKRSHPYKSFDQDHELGGIGGKRDLSTQIYSGQRPGSASSDNDSQKHILDDNNANHSKRIMVSQQVEISRS